MKLVSMLLALVLLLGTTYAPSATAAEGGFCMCMTCSEPQEVERLNPYTQQMQWVLFTECECVGSEGGFTNCSADSWWTEEEYVSQCQANGTSEYCFGNGNGEQVVMAASSLGLDGRLASASVTVGDSSITHRGCQQVILGREYTAIEHAALLSRMATLN